MCNRLPFNDVPFAETSRHKFVQSSCIKRQSPVIATQYSCFSRPLLLQQSRHCHVTPPAVSTATASGRGQIIYTPGTPQHCDCVGPIPVKPLATATVSGSFLPNAVFAPLGFSHSHPIGLVVGDLANAEVTCCFCRRQLTRWCCLNCIVAELCVC